MHRRSAGASGRFAPVPRMRGDAPVTVPSICASVHRSPHARGCTAGRVYSYIIAIPFPACAGMHHRTAVREWRPSLRSPHARGCTAIHHHRPCSRPPFPACAGMHRSSAPAARQQGAVPRMRGDAPPRERKRRPGRPRSPHARGCTGFRAGVPDGAGPFPACAGMHRQRSQPSFGACPVPRMRGDAPARYQVGETLTPRSPHARGCTSNFTTLVL